MASAPTMRALAAGTSSKAAALVSPRCVPPPRRAGLGAAPSSTARRSLACHAGKGGVLDSPTYTVNPKLEKSVDRKAKRSPPYKVMLHNDNYNRREYVVKVLLKVVESITVDDAVVVMQEAHETGVAMVVSCPQNKAEQYCESLRLSGLTSTIEPDA